MHYAEETGYVEEKNNSIIHQQAKDWLKFLKDRVGCEANCTTTWKPSDEQIKAVKLARSFVVDDFYEHPALSEILIELEEQLKKLREE